MNNDFENIKSATNTAKELFLNITLFFALYVFVITFMNFFSQYVPQWLSYLTHTLTIFMAFGFIFMVVVFAKTCVNFSPTTIIPANQIRRFIIVRIIFTLLIFLFFLLLCFWIAVFGGALNSSLSSLLTSAPVFFIFGLKRKYIASLEKEFSINPWALYKNYLYCELLFIAFTYIVYLVTVLNVDLTLIHNNAFTNVLKDYSAKIHKDDLLKQIDIRNYTLFSMIILFGSVLSTIAPFFIVKNTK